MTWRDLFCRRRPAPPITEPGSTLEDVMQALRLLTEKVSAMNDGLASGISTLQSDVAALTAQVTANSAVIAAFPAQLAAAVAAATAAGATPEQLQALNDLHTQITADVAALAVSDQPAAATGAAS